MSAAALLLVLAAATPAPPAPPPPDSECLGVAALQAPLAFAPGEQLEFALDALGAQAGKMAMQVMPLKDGALPVRVQAQTNTFFSKVRRVNGQAVSYLNPKSLRPLRYTEDATENDVRKTQDVVFHPDQHRVDVHFS